MVQEKPNFIKGCTDNGVGEEIATKIWDKMEKFCEYAFNKSHSTGYAIIAAQTAWLKYYFYKEYMAEVLNSYLQKPDKLSHYIESVKSDGLIIERPDVNNSGLYFKAGQDQSIIFGLSGIKNMGSFAEDVIKERMANGKYESFYDFLVRVHDFANTRAISSLIDSGAFDGLHPSRRGMKNKLNSILSSIRNQFKNNVTGQLGFFNSQSISIDQGQSDEEYTDFAKIELEYEATGMYITTHPVLLFKELLKKRSNVQDEIQIDLGRISTQSQDHSGTNLLVGITTNLRNFHTSKGAHIMSFNIEDDRGKIKGVMFVNDDNINNSGYIQENGVVIMEGEIVTSEKYGKQFKVKFVQDSLDHCFPSARGMFRA